MAAAKSRPTLRSIAERVGVTANTVSLALKDSPLVAPDTKRRIVNAARDMGYVQNALAGSLRSGRSHLVAIIVGDVSNLLFAIKIRALEDAFRRQGYQVMILSTGEDPEQERRAVTTAISRKADGVLLCPCQRTRDGLALLRQHGVPCVLLGRHFGDECDAVVWDDRRGGYLAGRHMLELGLRRVMLLTAPGFISSARERREGFEQALRESGVASDPALVHEVSPTSGGAARLLEDIDELDCDGIFAFSDLMAWEAACVLRARGLERMALMGFDDIQAHVSIPYGLSSIGASIAEETGQAVRLLTARMQGDDSPPQLHMIGVHLAARESTLNARTRR